MGGLKANTDKIFVSGRSSPLVKNASKMTEFNSPRQALWFIQPREHDLGTGQHKDRNGTIGPQPARSPLVLDGHMAKDIQSSDDRKERVIDCGVVGSFPVHKDNSGRGREERSQHGDPLLHFLCQVDLVYILHGQVLQ